MRDLSELIEIYRNKALFNEINLELAQSLNKSNKSTINTLIKNNMEENLIATLLDILGEFIEYDSVTMTYQIDFLIFKQLVNMHIPISESDGAVIAVIDMNSQDCIDVIELDGPMTKDELEKFAKDYYSKL